MGRLPLLDAPQPYQALIVQGLLVSSSPGQIRMILDGLWMEFAAEDVIDAEELPPPEMLRPSAAVHVRLWLRPGIQLLGVGASEQYRESLFISREPFAIAVRHGEVRIARAPKYSALEAKYLDAHGLSQLPR